MLGKTVNNFILQDQDGKDFELYRNLNKKLLLVFYPKDNSPVCTKQLKNYRDNIELFHENGINVLGINIEGFESHKTFCDSLDLNFPIIHDKNKQVSKELDALNIFGLNKRKLILIDVDKKILYEKSTISFKYLKSADIINDLQNLKLI